MPGRALSWSLVAVLRSSLSAESAAAPIARCAAAGEMWTACRRNNASSNAKVLTTSCRFLSFIEFSLGVNATLANSVSHAVDGQHIGCDAIVNLVSLGVANDIAEGRDHDFFQLLINHGFFP